MSTADPSSSGEGTPQRNKQAPPTTNNTCFVVTGFGPFGGVPSNPTKVLVEKLGSFLASTDPQLAAHIHDFILLETSARAVRATVDKLQKQLYIQHDHHRSTVHSQISGPPPSSSLPEQKDVLAAETGRHLRGSIGYDDETSPCPPPEGETSVLLLHLGVDASSKGFKLERCAWNDATFRIPDEQGYRPTREKIVQDQSYEQCTTTRLDLPQLCTQMTDMYPTISTTVSEDAGRFVCNYIYCCSLDAFENREKVTSLFLHVPPFDVVSEEQQLEYVANLMRQISNTEW